MFMAYIELSVLFLITFGIEIAYKEVWLNYMSSGEEQELYGYPVQVNTSLPKVSLAVLVISYVAVKTLFLKAHIN